MSETGEGITIDFGGVSLPYREFKLDCFESYDVHRDFKANISLDEIDCSLDRLMKACLNNLDVMTVSNPLTDRQLKRFNRTRRRLRTNRANGQRISRRQRKALSKQYREVMTCSFQGMVSSVEKVGEDEALASIRPVSEMSINYKKIKLF